MADGLISVVPRDPAGDGPDWLGGLRARAAAHLHDAGFPGKKHERWRFTSVRDVVDTAFAPAEADRGATAFADERLGDDGTWRVVVHAGQPTIEGDAPDGVTVRALAEVLASDAASVEGVLGAIVKGEHFAALNAALFTDGVVIAISENADVTTPIHVVHVATPGEEPSASYPRVLVMAGAGSRATLVESFVTNAGDGDAKHLTNTVAELSIGPNARLEHVRITEGHARALQIAYLGARLDRDAFYGSRVVALGGGLTRVELGVRFEGPGAEVELDGAYHVDTDDHVDHQIRVDHVAGRCTSHVRYRGLLDGRGHAVFNAEGIVHRDAAGSAAHQENRNLLLSDHATVDTKPHLEIDCDDVAASHGTTVGALDDASRFYLRSRGIPDDEARDILTYAFVREVIDAIGHAPLVKRASAAVLARLPHGEALAEGMSE